MAEKADPFHHKRRWENWKKTLRLKTNFGTKVLSKKNYDLIVSYLLDMEAGLHVASKGRRSYIRLNSIKQRISWVIGNMGMDDITLATHREVTLFFNQMRDGTIRRLDGKPFKSTIDYIKVFCAFWHWYQKQEPNRVVPDITQYLETENKQESDFVYFTIDDLRRVANDVKFVYRVIMWFLFDSGIRSPTELMSLRVGDFHYMSESGIYEVDIRDAYAKTFGRKIKLVLSSDLLRDHLKDKQPDEPFFKSDWKNFYMYLRRAFVRILGDKGTKGGKSFGQIKPYDFRHSSACYWILCYKQEAAFKYRFGWKENRMIHYYTNFLGMQDTITQEDILLNPEAKTKLQQELEKQKQANLLMEERLKRLEETIMQKALVEISNKMETIPNNRV